ncbi:MAG: GNAT family N-acetyltransferase [Xanthobacteraceae bacterium]
MNFSIRPARPGEAGLALQFIRELAEYEKLTGECVATEAMIDAALFGATPRLICDFAEWNGEVVGFAVWYLTFSTFSGKAGLYLEDLFVRPEHRGKGIGKALMVHLARKCAVHDCDHFQWSVLDWNTPSIDFYKSLGAEMLDEWTGVRVSGHALARLAERA